MPELIALLRCGPNPAGSRFQANPTMAKALIALKRAKEVAEDETQTAAPLPPPPPAPPLPPVVSDEAKSTVAPKNAGRKNAGLNKEDDK